MFGAIEIKRPPDGMLDPEERAIDDMRIELHKAVRNFDTSRVQELLSNDKCPIDQAIIEDAAVAYYNKSVFELIVKYLAARRRHLMKVARDNGLMKSIPEYDQRLLDVKASEIATSLLWIKDVDYDVVRSSVYDFGQDSVYTLVGCNQDAAQMLYDSGFESVDELNDKELSPLAALKLPSTVGYHGDHDVYDGFDAVIRYLGMCAWYYEKGASLTRKFGPAGQTPLHHIARQAGKGFAAAFDRYITPPFHKTPPVRYAPIFRPLPVTPVILKEILRDTTHRDQYSCPCSVGGGLPLNILLNELLRELQTPSEMALMIAHFLGLDSDMFVKCESTSEVGSAVFRACIFDSLCVNHSCDLAEEKGDIRYQKGGPITNVDLDFLVFLFDMAWAKSCSSLPEYIISKWPDEVEHFLVEYIRGASFFPDLGGNGILDICSYTE
ncbi:hypothetical protein BDV18DRAFT_161916 [Aspergillus unguis]